MAAQPPVAPRRPGPSDRPPPGTGGESPPSHAPVSGGAPSSRHFDIVFEEHEKPLGLGMMELYDEATQHNLLVLDRVSGPAAERHPQLRPGLVVEAIAGAPTGGAFSAEVRAKLSVRPVTITFVDDRKAAQQAAKAGPPPTAASKVCDEELVASILAKKAEAEAEIKSKRRFGLRRVKKDIKNVKPKEVVKKGLVSAKHLADSEAQAVGWKKKTATADAEPGPEPEPEPELKPESDPAPQQVADAAAAAAAEEMAASAQIEAAVSAGERVPDGV